MKLVVNGAAVSGTSLGGKRYFHNIFSRLSWPGGTEVRNLAGAGSLARIHELVYRGRQDEIFWTPSQRGPIRAHNHVVTVLDCINVEYVYRNDWRLATYRRLFNSILNNASAVVAISRATRDSILRNYRIDPDKIIVIPGPNDFSTELSQHSPTFLEERPFGEERPFVLLFSNLLPHKNTARAVSAFAASSAARCGISLRIVGPVEPTALAECRAAGVMVEQYVGVEDVTLQRWLRSCRFMLSPSLEEGLNLPIGEAISIGANVLCSDIPVHREFFDGQVRFFDPKDISSIAYELDLAFDEPDPWVCEPALPYRRTFDDVTKEYSELFNRVAMDASPRKR